VEGHSVGLREEEVGLLLSIVHLLELLNLQARLPCLLNSLSHELRQVNRRAGSAHLTLRYSWQVPGSSGTPGSLRVSSCQFGRPIFISKRRVESLVGCLVIRHRLGLR